jgi:hypothetical protein
MPTPKQLRAAPNRVFENYVLTKEIGPSSGISKFLFDNFSKFDNFVSNPWVDGDITSVLSSEFDIGFPFLFDGVTYTKFVASTNGWIALVDPAVPFSYAQVLDGADLGYNYNIKSTISTNAVLIAPWFDDLRNLSNSLVPGVTFGEYPITNANFTSLFEQGVNQPPSNFDPTDYGCRYYRTDKTQYGRCLIVRWNSTSFSSFDSKTRFEAALYENGRIEFRYDKRIPQVQSDSTRASIGIFMPGTNRFRDFSYGLGYRDNERQQYEYGGATYSSGYSDTDVVTKPYSVRLKVTQNWPGLSRFGAKFVFQPPMNRRRILSRVSLRNNDNLHKLPAVKRTGEFRLDSRSSLFDDRNSIVYGPSVVNYPTTLPRFFGDSSEGISERQDLFKNDFLVTGSVIKSLVQDFIGNKPQQFLLPFNESNRFEQASSALNDPFFEVGTPVSEVGSGFAQPLRSKTQIKLSFRVDHKTKLFPASSSIYYYNTQTKRWQYPTASFSAGFDIANPYNDVINQRLIEVDRGFNAVGFNVGSGSSDRSTGDLGTDYIINKGWTRENESNALVRPMSKSVTANQEYSANADESFVLPINQPFLLEKAVIEFPIEAGPGWFSDKTRCFMSAYDTGMEFGPAARTKPFDLGGPGVTFALYNQLPIKSGETRRDLIMSATFTHEFDAAQPTIVYGASPDIYSSSYTAYQINPVGFTAYGGTPAAVVSGSSSFFTGTVQLKCEPAISNGVLVRDTIYLTQIVLDNLTGSLHTLFNTKQWSLAARGSIESFNSDIYGNGFRERTIVGVNNLGRGGTGFQPSGRSIFGKEYVTSQGLNKKYYDNPFYLYGSQEILDQLTAIATPGSPFFATSIINQQVSKVSPYLLFPNDRLVLSISKSRPFFFSTLVSSPYTSGSISHDIKLSTGSINITLYGSLVSNGSEYHDTLNQELASDAVHEVVVGETKTW